LELPAENGTRKVTIESIKTFTDLELLRSKVHAIPAGMATSN
jgi:hypothetical protein